MRLKQLGENATIILNNKTEEKGIKSADAFENGIRTEYERITEKSTNIETSIKNHLRSGKEQAGRIVVWIDRKYELSIIKKSYDNAKYYDSKNKIKEVIFLDKSGKGIKL